MVTPGTGISYLPRLLTQRLSRLDNAPISSWDDRLDGAILIADISGFADLTERLALRGPAGAEFDQEAAREIPESRPVTGFGNPSDARLPMPRLRHRRVGIQAAIDCGWAEGLR